MYFIIIICLVIIVILSKRYVNNSDQKVLSEADNKPVHYRRLNKRYPRLSKYTKDWNSISLNLRIISGWKCSNCNVVLTRHKSLLHVHHIDRDKNNNESSNLKVLCKLCHRQEGLLKPFGFDDHSIMENDDYAWIKDRTTIEDLRLAQSMQTDLCFK